MLRKQASLMLLACSVCAAVATPPEVCIGSACDDGTLLMQKQHFAKSRSSQFQEITYGLKEERKQLKKQISQEMMSLKQLKNEAGGEDQGVAHQLLSLVDRFMFDDADSEFATTTHAPARALWSQYGEKDSKCTSDAGVASASFSACEFEAGKTGNNFFSFNNATKMCAISNSCESPMQELGWLTFHGSADAGSTPTDWVGFKNSIVATMEKLKANLADERRVSEKYATEAHARFDHCHTTSSSSTYKQSYRSGIEPHRTCRTEAKSLETTYDTCMAKKAGEKVTMDLAVAAFNEVNDDSSDSVCDSVKRASGESMKAWLERVRSHFDQKYTTFVDKEAEMTRSTQVYQSTDADCTPSRTPFHSKEEHCNSTLSRMETSSCAWARESKSLCDNYDVCYSDKVEAYGLLKSEVAQEEQRRKLEFQMGERIKCLVNSIDGDGKIDTVSIGNCDKKDGYDDAHLEAQILAVPEAQACSVPDEYPCTEAYTTQVYGGMVDGARLAKCQPCDGVSAHQDSANQGGEKRTCADWLQAGASDTREYDLTHGDGETYKAKCDMDRHGGGWTRFAIIQPRSGLTCTGDTFCQVPESTEFVDTCKGQEWIFARSSMVDHGGQLMARQIAAPHKTFLVDWLYEGSQCSGEKFFKIVTGDYSKDASCKPRMFDFGSNKWVESADGWCNANDHSQFNCVAENYSSNGWPGSARGIRFHYGVRNIADGPANGGSCEQIHGWWTGWTSSYGSDSGLIENFDSWDGQSGGPVELFYRQSPA